MNRTAFFSAIRPYFGGSLSEPQVKGMEALLDAGAELPLHHMANVLAQVRRETGGYMSPIKETVMPSHKNKNPSDAEVILRLDRAFSAGKLKWVKTPYWREGWFGRGQIQITHRDNYAKFGIKNPDDALKLDVSARVAVEGMSRGMFTGKKLGDYRFPEALYAPPKTNPRRIVNGVDGSDTQVAMFHRQFAEALLAGRWTGKPVPLTRPAEHVKEKPKTEHKRPTPIGGIVAGVLAAIAAVAAWWGGL